MGRRTEKTFFQEKMQMANNHMNKFSTSLIFREMQSKSTRKYHLVPVRTAIIIKDNKCWWDGREKGAPVHSWWEGKLVQHNGKPYGGFSNN